MDQNDETGEVVVPVVAEEVHADAIPVETGGVRVIKRVEGHDEIIEQELRKDRVEVKRIKTDRVVDGPQEVRRVGKTLIVPVVAEVLRITKEWVVTEEIHLTQIEEHETVQQRVTVNRENAEVERLDEKGNAVGRVDARIERDAAAVRERPASLVTRPGRPKDPGAEPNRTSSRPRSLLGNKSRD